MHPSPPEGPSLATAVAHPSCRRWALQRGHYMPAPPTPRALPLLICSTTAMHRLRAPSLSAECRVAGATEAINLVAQTWGLQEMKEGDEIIVSVMEHHANLVPWQMLQERTGPPPPRLSIFIISKNNEFPAQGFVLRKTNINFQLLALHKKEMCKKNTRFLPPPQG